MKELEVTTQEYTEANMEASLPRVKWFHGQRTITDHYLEEALIPPEQVYMLIYQKLAYGIQQNMRKAGYIKLHVQMRRWRQEHMREDVLCLDVLGIEDGDERRR